MPFSKLQIKLVSDRRQQLKRFFAASDCRALFIDGQFNSEQVSRYFMESV